MPPASDLTGKRFGSLIAMERIGSKWGKALWRCECNCGQSVDVAARALVSGNTKSCGCSHVKHGHSIGHSHSGTYTSWNAMINRCTVPSYSGFQEYGGKGVKVCERWLSFANFLADMGERPSGTSIDRFPDRAGNYQPGNCRWATPHEQNVNRSVTKLTLDLVQEIRGRHEHGEGPASIARRMNVSQQHVGKILSNQRWKESAL